MATKVERFNEALERKQRAAIIDQLRADRDLTIDELIRVREAQGDSLGDITVGELISGRPGRSARPARRKRAARKARRRGGRKKVDTRTAEGRELYDASVFQAVKSAKGSVTADAVREQVGGTGDQMRRSLGRLVDTKKVKRSGRGRGTKYEAK
jgi:hypothetical protein